MTEFSGLWTTSGTPTGDQQTSYTQAQLSTAFDILAACSQFEGVAPGYGNELSPSDGGANTVDIDTGGAVVDGKYYDNSAVESINIPSAVGGGNTRIDRIVARASWSGFTVRLTRIAGTDAASPTVPAITQTPGTTYDIKICQVLVDTAGNVTVTDERDWSAPDVDNSTIVIDQSTGAIKVQDGGVVEAKIAAGSVTNTKIGALAVGTSKIASGAVNDDKIGVNAVTETKIGVNAVTETKVANGAITEAKLAAAASAKLVTNGNSHDHNGGDGAQIPTGGIANDAIDDTKAGNRIIQMTRRQGGHASDWNIAGTTTYTPTTIRQQVGYIQGTIPDVDSTVSVVVTFPIAFSAAPAILLTVGFSAFSDTGVQPAVKALAITTNQFTLQITTADGSNVSGAKAVSVFWLAIGSE